ncbi:hexose transporter [Moniliophthora roreri]|nr:hexose transporter [Moniliophthora roreri]
MFISAGLSVASNIDYKVLFTTKGNLKHMRIVLALAFFSQWSGNGLFSYYYYLNRVLTHIDLTESFDQLLNNHILSIWNFCWVLLASFMVEKVRWQFLFLASCSGTTKHKDAIANSAG